MEQPANDFQLDIIFIYFPPRDARSVLRGPGEVYGGKERAAFSLLAGVLRVGRTEARFCDGSHDNNELLLRLNYRRGPKRQKKRAPRARRSRRV